MTVAFHLSDGSIEFRDSLTMENLFNETVVDEITSLRGAGFAFPVQLLGKCDAS